MTDDTVPVDPKLLEDVQQILEERADTESLAIASEIEYIFENYVDETSLQHYYEEFERVETTMEERIAAVKSQRQQLRSISEAVRVIDCDWGASSVDITEEMNGTTRLEISAHTHDRCKPIDRLYDLEDEVTRFEASVEMKNTDAEQRLIHWTFTITI